MKKIFLLLAVAALTFSACSDDYMGKINTDESKVSNLDPNAQLTTALLQTYGDFSLMDTYRCYITGFAQYFAGGWNVTAHAGSNYYYNDYSRKIWDRYYEIAIKNLVDGIHNSTNKPNLNAALRIHRVYLTSVLADTYGDVPCLQAGLGYLEGISTPKYDTVEELYNWFFTELATCEAQLGTGTDHLTGDVTNLKGDVAKWKKYANSLRLRFAMRISDVNAAKAQAEFEAALNNPAGIIASADDEAFVIYSDSPFTEYPGSEDFDFRTNSLCQILYGQDYASPTFISSMMFNQLKKTNDPRLYRFVRHYYNIKRSQTKPDKDGNMDLTDEVLAYFAQPTVQRDEVPCNPGAAWYDNWIDAIPSSELPTLAAKAAIDPNNYDNSDCLARLARPWLNIDFEMATCPGYLMSYAEVEFLLAEAKDKGWNVPGTVAGHYEAGVRASMEMLNDYYLTSDKITATEITNFIAANPVGAGGVSAKESINTQAWILHMMNPAEGWANMRRSDFPKILDRPRLKNFPGDGFVYNDGDMSMPTRLKYPLSEDQLNHDNYRATLNRMGGTDDWHKKLWWDMYDINVQPAYTQPYYNGVNEDGSRKLMGDFGYIN